MLWLDTVAVQIMYTIARIPCDSSQEFLKSIAHCKDVSTINLQNWCTYLESMDFIEFKDNLKI